MKHVHAFFSSPAVYLYITAVVLVNIGFSYVPLIPTALGLLSPMAVIVGLVFVFRDYAQRQSGHTVIAAMLIGVALSYLLADPFVATASAAAFAVSEFVDWLIYTVTGKPFGERVLISSAIATPVDTAVFLFGISDFTLGTFILMVLSKMVASFAIFMMYRKQPRNVYAGF